MCASLHSTSNAVLHSIVFQLHDYLERKSFDNILIPITPSKNAISQYDKHAMILKIEKGTEQDL